MGLDGRWAALLVVLAGCRSDATEATTSSTAASTTDGDVESSAGTQVGTTGDVGEELGGDEAATTLGEGGHGGGSTGDDPADCGDELPGRAIDAEAVIALDCGSREGCVPSAEDLLAARLDGPFTLVAEVRLDERPFDEGPIVSRWDTGGQRAYEIGIDQSQQPYLWLSVDGSYDPDVPTYARAYQQLRLGESYEVAVVVEPGERIAMFVDGVRVREQLEVTDTIHVGTADLVVGGRPGEDDTWFADSLGRVRMFDSALSDEDIAALAVSGSHCSELPGLAPITQLTQGPEFHWFGYYDKFQLDPSDRYVLGMAADFQDRAVTGDDVVELGMVDLHDDNAWITLGESRAFNWQQGCMLQWVPGSDTEVIWNDREGEGADAHYVARVLDTQSGEQTTLSRPIFTVAPDGETALGIDFERYADMTAGYGYVGIPDPNLFVAAPDDAGIYAISLSTGESELVVSYEEVAAIPSAADPLGEGKHFFYALLVNPSGTRFFFYDRALIPGHGQHTRVFTADLDGSNLFLLEDGGDASHIDWQDDTHVVMFSHDYDGYARFADGVGFVEDLLEYSANGHQTFLPDGDWMVSDTYADVFDYQHPFLYHLPSDEVFALAHLYSPPEFSGSDRCDNHPRQSRDGRRIVVDSAQDGGRQMYMIDLAAIVDGRSLGR